MKTPEDEEFERIEAEGWRKRQVEQSEMCSNYGGFCKKEWVRLTDEDKSLFSSWLDHKTDDEVFTAIEAKLKEKDDDV